ncbi:MAG TPA: hypothetical protein VE650_02955, partial [Acetobacteraceae bacterium]|nr:hypothetical protein [Acetobacteraceae bacterium]
MGGILLAVIGAALLGFLISMSAPGPADGCTSESTDQSITLGPPGSGQLVGATEYGGPGDPSSGTMGASGSNLLSHPDSYAELGGVSFQTATAIGGLPYMTPLRITWSHRSAIAYKRDFGLGGGPVAGLPRVIDLWWQLAGRLGIPYQGGGWSGPVRIERVASSGAAGMIGNVATGTGAPS